MSDKLTATFKQKLEGAIGSFTWLPRWSWEYEWHRAVLPVLRDEIRFGTDLEPSLKELFATLTTTPDVKEAVRTVKLWIEKN